MLRQRLSDEEKKFQTQLLNEKDLVRLTRQYNILDKAYVHAQFTRSSSLAKSSNVLNIFQKEHANILLDLQRAAAPGRIRNDDKQFEEISTLLDTNTFFKDNINEFKIYLLEIEKEKKKVEKEVKVLRKQQLTDRQHEERVRDAIKTLEALENKLETQMIQLGTICTKNKELKEEIDHYLWQRYIFMDQWNKLINKLAEGKQIMLDLIEQATVAYNQREEWCTLLQILRVKAHNELNSNQEEMREYKRKCDQSHKLKEFFWIKGQKRIMKDLEKRKLIKQQNLEENLKEKLQTYQNMLREINNFTKTKDVKKIARNFVLREEVNLTNFKYIVDLIEDTESEAARLSNLYDDIDHKYSLHDTRVVQQQKTLEILTENLEDAIEKAQESKKFLDEAESELNALLAGVSHFFHLCKCDRDPLIKLLADNTEVNIFNADLYVKILEQTKFNHS